MDQELIRSQELGVCTGGQELSGGRNKVNHQNTTRPAVERQAVKESQVEQFPVKVVGHLPLQVTGVRG